MTNLKMYQKRQLTKQESKKKRKTGQMKEDMVSGCCMRKESFLTMQIFFSNLHVKVLHLKTSKFF